MAGGSRTDADDSKACIEKTQLADLSEVGRAVAGRIVGRGFFEKRHNTVDDDGLVGLLKFCQCLLKHNPPFKTSTEGQVERILVNILLYIGLFLKDNLVVNVDKLSISKQISREIKHK